MCVSVIMIGKIAFTCLFDAHTHKRFWQRAGFQGQQHGMISSMNRL